MIPQKESFVYVRKENDSNDPNTINVSGSIKKSSDCGNSFNEIRKQVAEEYSDYDNGDENTLVENKEEENIIRNKLSSVYFNLYQYCIEEEKNVYSDLYTKITTLQTTFKAQYYSVIVKWLTRVNLCLRFPKDILYNAISCFSILLSRKFLAKDLLQQYSIVCYWISAKLDNKRNVFTTEHINHIINANYSRESYFEKEKEVLNILMYQLNHPSVHFFVRLYINAFEFDKDLVETVNYIFESILSNFEILRFYPSHVSISIILYCIYVLHVEDEHLDIIRYSSHIADPSSIQQIIKIVEAYFTKQNSKLKEYHEQRNNEEALRLLSRIDFGRNVSDIVCGM